MVSCGQNKMVCHVMKNSSKKGNYGSIVEGGSNEYPQSMFWAEIWKTIRIFHVKIFIFWW